MTLFIYLLNEQQHTNETIFIHYNRKKLFIHIKIEQYKLIQLKYIYTLQTIDFDLTLFERNNNKFQVTLKCRLIEFGLNNKNR